MLKNTKNYISKHKYILYFVIDNLQPRLSFVQKKDINALHTTSVNILQNTKSKAKYHFIYSFLYSLKLLKYI